MANKIWKPELNNHQEFEIGDGCVIHSFTWIGAKVKIGNNVKIQAMVFIPDGVTLEDDVFIGPGVIFTNDPHLKCQGSEFWKETIVRKGAKIGAGAMIKAGVTIGENVVVGMGAVVLKDIPANEVWCGNPARFLRLNVK